MKHINEVLTDIAKENTDQPRANLDLSMIYDIEISGIDMKDFPDFSDAYISKASYHERELTESECIEVQEIDSEWFYEKVCEEIYGE